MSNQLNQWYTIPLPDHQSERDELIQVFSVWQRFDFKRFLYDIKSQLDFLKQMRENFGRAEAEFTKWKLRRNFNSFGNQCESDVDILSGIVSFQQFMLAERIKKVESVCEQLIETLGQLPNPTPCLKRFKEELETKQVQTSQDLEANNLSVQNQTQSEVFSETHDLSTETTNSYEPLNLDFSFSTHQESHSPISVSSSEYSSSSSSKPDEAKNQHAQIKTPEIILYKNLEKMEFDTVKLARHVEHLRLKKQMSRGELGRITLDMTERTLRRYLLKPEPWATLSEDRKRRYRKLYAWCCVVDPETSKKIHVLENPEILKTPHSNYRHCPANLDADKFCSTKSKTEMDNVNLSELASELFQLLDRYRIRAAFFAYRKLHMTKPYFEEFFERLHKSTTKWSDFGKYERLTVARIFVWVRHATREQWNEMKVIFDKETKLKRI